MIYVLSDVHFGHRNICRGESNWANKSGCRDFDTVHEMNKEITQSINNAVKTGDTLYHLGDWSFGGHNNVEVFRHHINCNDVRLILGNHDHSVEKYKHLFTWVKHYHEFRHNKLLFCLFHYSMRVWNESHRGAIHCYGHSHGTLPGLGRSLDVGWDVWKRPLSIDEIYDEMIKITPHKIDHHNEETNV